MQFYDVIKKRTSVKKFKSTPIERDKLARMVTAAMMSPSWKNNASYKFILVDDLKQKEYLAQSVVNKSDDAADAVREAPMAAVIVADPSESGNVGDKEYFMVDAAIAMEHFVLAATSEGYGTCWIAALDEEKVRQALSVPQSYRVVAMTPVGEILEPKEHYPKKDTGDYFFINSWNNAYVPTRVELPLQ